MTVRIEPERRQPVHHSAVDTAEFDVGRDRKAESVRHLQDRSDLILGRGELLPQSLRVYSAVPHNREGVPRMLTVAGQRLLDCRNAAVERNAADEIAVGRDAEPIFRNRHHSLQRVARKRVPRRHSATKGAVAEERGNEVAAVQASGARRAGANPLAVSIHEPDPELRERRAVGRVDDRLYRLGKVVVVGFEKQHQVAAAGGKPRVQTGCLTFRHRLEDGPQLVTI